ncbi:MAG: hypothetical protein NTV29_10675 [Planctomycetota bacterium]|nr:hypothetical protein [Planctomycetota bacterium]
MSKHPGIRLSRLGLTGLILGAILIPVCSAVALFFLSKPMTEPLLDARVRLDGMWVQDPKNPGQQKLVPAISIWNPTSEPWSQLTIGINKFRRSSQFYASEPSGIPAGKTVSIPLSAFIARNGSVPFPVGTRNVREVTVFAKLPNSARGVCEFVLPETPTVPKSGQSEAISWVSPVASD